MQTAQRTAKRVMLGHELAHFRTALAMTQSELGRAISKSQSKIGWLEQGQATVTAAELEILLGKLMISDKGHRDALRLLHADSHKRGNWTTGYNRAYGEDLRLLVDLERHCDQIFISESEIIPALLQCRSYVRELCDPKQIPRGLTVEDVVDAWTARQEILTNNSPFLLHVVLSESSLRRKHAPSPVMREQMKHLEKVSRLPNVVLQVLPFDNEGFARVPRPFTLLRVPSPGLAGPLRMAYVEGEGEIRYRDEEAAVNAHEDSWARLTGAAFGPKETRQFIRYISGTFL